MRKHQFLRHGLIWLFILTLIAAGLYVSIGHDVVRARIEQPVIDNILAAGGTVGYAHQYDPTLNTLDHSRPPPGTYFERLLFGRNIRAKAIAVMLHGTSTSDADVRDLHRLSDLLDVSLNGCGITDGCIDDLVRIEQLRQVALNDTSVTPIGLGALFLHPQHFSASLCMGTRSATSISKNYRGFHACSTFKYFARPLLTLA